MGEERKKVVWFEGMTLDPHHFQQWDRYRNGVLDARFRSVAPNGWGLSRCKIDEERLANGELHLVECAGVMPDGLVFDVPELSPVPEARSVQDHLSSTDETVRVMLAVPAHRPDGRNVRLQGRANGRDERFIAESTSVPDENTSGNERPVEVAHTNVQVRFEDESQEGYTTLPIAEVERSAGGFALNDQFLPPCLSIEASDRLVELTREVLELLVTRSADLQEYQEEAFAQRELSPSDILSLSLCGTINAYIPKLNRLHTQEERHPQELLSTLTSLAGELSTYVENVSVQPRNLPTYDHTAPAASFAEIAPILRRMLGDATPSADYKRLDLQQKRDNLYVASVERQLLEEAQLFVFARSEEHSEKQLTDSLPEMLRVSSPSTIDSVLQSYTQALDIAVTRRLPASMPVDSQATYFKMQKHGSHWDAICEEEGVAIFVPSDIQNVEVRLIAAI